MLWLDDFISLIFPRICACCGNSLWKHEERICHSCDFRLPRTDFHLAAENPVTRLFWGRVPVEAACACLYFNKGNRVQRLVHQLKYKGRKDIGIWLGAQYGHELCKSPLFSDLDAIIPVPLHKKRYMQRGYNQSEQFATGLGGPMNLPVVIHLLIRSRATETQTRKSRFSRYQNVHDIFEVRDPEYYRGKHLLLVDDVITTGSTLESSVLAMMAIPEVKISIACIAAAML